MNILNLGAGKIDFDRWDEYVSHGCKVLHVDRYFDFETTRSVKDIPNFSSLSSDGANMYCRSDIFEFVDNYKYKNFDLVFAERIFEHLEYTTGEVGRLLEGINTITKNNVQLEIIVPNAILIAKMLLDYEKNHSKYSHTESLNKKLIINTENHNFRSDAHASSWTPVLAKEYIESEGTWEVTSIQPKYKFAGRDIYMKIICTKK